MKEKSNTFATRSTTRVGATTRADTPPVHGPTEAIAHQVARKWSASFGVTDAVAISRLEAALAAAAAEALFDRSAIIDLERLLDEAAQIRIARWLAGVLQKPVESSVQAFAEARLAFLTVNSDSAWSHAFLDPDAPAAALRQAMAAVHHVATPPQRQQEIRRQSL